MKIKENFTLRRIADTWVILPLSEAIVNFNGMITLNESGVLLWNLLKNGCTREDLANELVKEYEVSYNEALADADEFVKKLEKAGCVDVL